MPHKQITGSAADWLKRAQSSLALAKVPRPKDTLWEDLCYHAQQAAEKALKAVLVKRKIRFRFVHDLNELIDTLEEHGQKMPEQVKKSVMLTGYAVATRYPGNKTGNSGRTKSIVFFEENNLNLLDYQRVIGISFA